MWTFIPSITSIYLLKTAKGMQVVVVPRWYIMGPCLGCYLLRLLPVGSWGLVSFCFSNGQLVWGQFDQACSDWNIPILIGVIFGVKLVDHLNPSHPISWIFWWSLIFNQILSLMLDRYVRILTIYDIDGLLNIGEYNRWLKYKHSIVVVLVLFS